MESEFYNSNTVSYKNTVKASQIIDFSQYGTSKELNEMGEGYPVLSIILPDFQTGTQMAA